VKHKSKGRLFLFQWDQASATQRADELSAAGWEVAFEHEDGARGGKAALAMQPDVIVFDLAKRSSHSRETANGIQGTKAGRGLKMVFVDGADGNLEKTKKKVTGGVYTTSAKLLKTLDELAK